MRAGSRVLASSDSNAPAGTPNIRARASTWSRPGIFSPFSQDSGYYASKFFLSAQGISAAGLHESHPLLVRTIQAFQELADEVVVLVDSSKFSIRARHIAMPLARVSTLITDDGLTETDRRILEDAGITVIIAAAGEVA